MQKEFLKNIKSPDMRSILRDWSLRGGLQNGRGGGACEVLPLRKGGGVEKVLAMLKEVGGR